MESNRTNGIAQLAVAGSILQSSAWVCQQFREAFPFETAPDYLIRDRDGVYGEAVSRCLASMGVEEIITAPRSPWQNPFVERLVGTLRRELLDHVIVLNRDHLMRLLDEFFTYYHTSRTHRTLDDNSPIPRRVEEPGEGEVVSPCRWSAACIIGIAERHDGNAFAWTTRRVRGARTSPIEPPNRAPGCFRRHQVAH